MSDKDTNWERSIIEKLAKEAYQEQRRSRRWGIFFKVLTFAYIAVLFIVLADQDWMGEATTITDEHAALIDVSGVIAEDTLASADHIITGLRDAFEAENATGIIIRINSPGGSPVQANYVYDEIKRLREKYPDKPVYAVISDLCASGGYYIAAAAEKIYASKSSLVGSIGVRMDSFGFVDSLEKLGIERRLLTAGEHKGFLDPFSPMKEEDRIHAEIMLNDIHQHFIDIVEEGRGEHLADEPKLYSGLIWSGERALQLGLVDELGSSGYVAREVFGVDKIVDYSSKLDFAERLADRLGAGAARILSAAGFQLR